MRLQQFSHQLTPHPLQLPLPVTMLHLIRLLRTEELCDCRIGLVRRRKGIRHGTGQRAHGLSALPAAVPAHPVLRDTRTPAWAGLRDDDAGDHRAPARSSLPAPPNLLPDSRSRDIALGPRRSPPAVV